jgi:hypothetical protein
MVFGKPMEFWHTQMPKGMWLRSAYYASSISDPHGALCLEKYEQTRGCKLRVPIPLADFVDYGMWFRNQAVPKVDPRRVTRIERNRSGFHVVTEDGERLYANRVIVAAGIARFAVRPSVFNSGLSSDPSITHSSQHRDFAAFAGRTVVVIGGGQSALESAALLSEAGAQAEVLARKPEIKWLRGKVHLSRSLRGLSRLLYCRSDVGPPLLTHIVSRPALLNCFPRKIRSWIAYRAIRPAGAGWLVTRLQKVPITTGREVTAVEKLNGKIKLRLNDGSTRTVDHVVLATGYQVDIARYDFLAPELLSEIRQVNGHPILGAGFESSVPGLHFLGAPGIWSFGPLVRFVSGTEYSSRALTNHVRGGVSWK